MELVLVNGQGLTETYGWTLEEGNYPQLLRAPKLKPSYTYSWPNADGEDYDPTAVPAKECQDFTLSFLIVAETKEELLIKYESFMNVLLDPAGTDWQFLEINKAFRLHFVDAVDWTDVDIYSGSARVSVTLRNRFVVPKTPANAPTAMVFDADNRTIDFTFNPEYTDLYDYEYTLDGGANWNVLAVKPIQLTISSYPVLTIGVRVQESANSYPSPVLWNSTAIAGDVIWGFVNSVTVGGYTFDEGLLRESWDALPLHITDGVTLVPYAYKTGVVGLIDNETGAVVDATFTRAGAGWAMQDGDIAELSAGVPRWDEFYYDDEVGYLVEKAATNDLADSNTMGATKVQVTSGSGYSFSSPVNVLMNSTAATTQFKANTKFVPFVADDLCDVSFFIKNNSSYEIFLAGNAHTLLGGWNSVVFDLDNNTVLGYYGPQANDRYLNVAIRDVNGWKHVQLTLHIANSNNAGLGIGFCHGGNYQLDIIEGDGVSNFDLKNINIGTRSSYIYTNGSAVTRPAESLQIPLSATSDIWLKYADHEGNIIEQVIEDVPSGNFNVHDQITNGKLLALIAPMRKFTGAERSVLND